MITAPPNRAWVALAAETAPLLVDSQLRLQSSFVNNETPAPRLNDDTGHDFALVPERIPDNARPGLLFHGAQKLIHRHSLQSDQDRTSPDKVLDA